MSKLQSIFFMNLIITCEHGGNLIPKEFEPYLSIPFHILNSHMAYDIGALDISNELYHNLLPHYKILYLYNEITRLLIDYNRSINHPKFFSQHSKTLPEKFKKHLINNYLKFRNNVKTFINESIESENMVIHLSIHSFTPIWKGKIRKTEIGILFDPQKQEEKQFAVILKNHIPLICHFNLPYRGTSDGHTQSLRNQFMKNYIGIEIEINQKFIENSYISKKIKKIIIEGIKKSLEIYHSILNKKNI